MAEEYAVFKSESERLEDGVLRFIASSSTVDRHDDTINQAGWVFRQSELPFLWAHDQKSPPLGTIFRRAVEDGKLLVDVRFDMADEFAASIYRKYTEGFMSGVSVGFNPLDAEPNDHGGIHFKRQELLETSAVPVPANPEAVLRDADGEDGDAFRRQLKWAHEIIERYSGAVERDGRVLRADLYDKVAEARDRLQSVLDAEERGGADDEDGDEDKEFFELEESDDKEFFELDDSVSI